MKELEIINNNGQTLTIDSKEIAEMTDESHAKILRKLEGDKTHVGIIPVLTKAQMGVSDYFIKSTYKDSSGKENKCYLCTKLGCDFLANKFTGEKGILFTAKYVKKFNNMEKELSINKCILPTTYKEALLLLVEKEEEKEKLLIDIKNKEQIIEKQELKVSLYDDFINTDNVYNVSEIAKSLAIKKFGRNKFYKYLRENEILIFDTREAYQKYIDRGYVIHRKVKYEIYNYDKEELQAYFTEKGVKWIYKKLIKDGYVIEKSIEQLIKELEK